MGEVAKWAILAVVLVSVVAIIIAFPIAEGMNVSVFVLAINTIVRVAGNAFLFARGLINNFFSPWARSILSGLFGWLIAKWLYTYGLKVIVWVNKYIFKG